MTIDLTEFKSLRTLYQILVEEAKKYRGIFKKTNREFFPNC